MTKTAITFDQAFALARKKDAGLEEFFLSHSAAQIEKITTWPAMKIALDTAAMVAYYKELSRDLLVRIKPKE